MGSPMIAMLQVQIDRLAEPAGYPQVDLDGGYGEETAQGLLNALTWISKDGCSTWLTCVPDNLRAEADNWLSQLLTPIGRVDATTAQATAPLVAMYLSTVGDTLGLDSVSLPTWMFTGTTTSGTGPPSGKPDQSWCLMFPGDTGCAPFLQAAAAKQRAAPVAAVHPGVIPPRHALPAKVPAASSLMARFQRLAAWQKVGLGAGAVLGVLYLNKRRVAARRGA